MNTYMPELNYDLEYGKRIFRSCMKYLKNVQTIKDEQGNDYTKLDYFFKKIDSSSIKQFREQYSVIALITNEEGNAYTYEEIENIIKYLKPFEENEEVKKQLIFYNQYLNNYTSNFQTYSDNKKLVLDKN